MTSSSVHLFDLPDEMLLYIVKRLDNLDVLYSLFGINDGRLDRIIREKTFSHHLNFTSILQHNATIESILDRFCHKILPHIHFNIRSLTVEPSHMERILLASHYPTLTQLKIVDFQRDSGALSYFTDDSSLRCIFKQQLTKLDLANIDYERLVGSLKEYSTNVYVHIVSYCKKLEHFNVIQTSTSFYPSLSIRYLSSSAFTSSILTHLSIKVKTFTDCLCLLDGRLQQLQTFIVNVHLMTTDLSLVHHMDDLPNMKCFSLIHYDRIEDYDDRIVSLLRRMISLEKLTLYLYIDCQHTIIDPKSLIDTFSTCSPRLQSFNFYLSTWHKKNDLSHYSFNYRTQSIVINSRCQEVLHMITAWPKGEVYHMFTLPFQFEKLFSIDRTFPNILFRHVVELWACNMVLLDHEFLLRIAQSFPLLRRLIMDDKFFAFDVMRMSDNIPSDKVAEFPHLIFLDIFRTNTATVDDFLNEKTTCMPRLASLSAQYEHLRIVTQDFTREETRRNCANVTRLVTYRIMVGSKEYYNYFPSL